jgi:predicted ATPase/DNA-binding CsgD family transcriptional regulator
MAGSVTSNRNSTLSHTLPVRLDSFVGRERELAELRRLLGRCRLLTLLGPGGVGKTRLAIELARQQFGHVDAVTFVDLSPVTEPDRLVAAVADALGVRPRPDETLLDTLGAELADRRVLVLLDGCERVVEAGARLVETLLLACPDLRVLTTSQESLRVPGEVTVPIGPMTLAEPSAETPAVLRADAVRLFVERAREQVPTFELTPANGAVVADICARLDGLPLAIELAARWTRLLPVEELRGRLSDRFALLTLAPRTASKRHRNLRAAITWGMDLLDPVERAVFRRLSVFSGGFDLGGVTAVCAGEGMPRHTVLRALSSLEAKSLVVPAGRQRREARFTLLESIRLCGLDELGQTGELGATHDRLVDWLSGVVDALPERVFAAADTLRTLVEERDNLLSATRWAAGRGDRRQHLLAVTAARCAWEAGDPAGAWLLLGTVLDAEDVDPGYASLALQQAAWLDCWEGSTGRALARAEAAVARERTLDRPLALGEAMGMLALARLARGDFSSAGTALREALAVVRPLGQARHTARWLHNLAWTTLRAGDPRRAAALLDEARSLVDREAEPVLLATALHTTGALALAREHTDGAESAFRESLRASPANPYHTPRAVEGMAIVAARREQAERALRLIGAATALRAGRREPDPVWRCCVDLAADEARALLHRPDAALSAGYGLSAEHAVDYALDDAWREPRADDAAEHRLTERECDVARLVAGGMTNRQIACRLAVSARTVDAHLQHVRDKLGLRSRAEVAVWAAEHLPARPVPIADAGSAARKGRAAGLPGVVAMPTLSRPDRTAG